MSIYVVHLASWYPPGDEMYEFAKMVVECQRCHACGKRVTYRKALGYHSVPWGYGEIWCSYKHYQSGKVKKPDKRRERRLRRRSQEIELLLK